MAQHEALSVDKYENQIVYIANIWSSGVVLFGHLLLREGIKETHQSKKNHFAILVEMHLIFRI
jgi:hypothetical protein